MPTNSKTADPDEIEPAIKAVLERTLEKRARGPYSARSDQQVREGLERLFLAEGYRDVAIMELRRLAGGASKEMFCFSLGHDGIEKPERLVRRMEQVAGIREPGPRGWPSAWTRSRAQPRRAAGGRPRSSAQCAERFQFPTYATSMTRGSF